MAPFEGNSGCELKVRLLLCFLLLHGPSRATTRPERRQPLPSPPPTQSPQPQPQPPLPHPPSQSPTPPTAAPPPHPTQSPTSSPIPASQPPSPSFQLWNIIIWLYNQGLLLTCPYKIYLKLLTVLTTYNFVWTCMRIKQNQGLRENTEMKHIDDNSIGKNKIFPTWQNSYFYYKVPEIPEICGHQCFPLFSLHSRLLNSPLFNSVRYYQVNRKTPTTPILWPKGKKFGSHKRFSDLKFINFNFNFLFPILHRIVMIVMSLNK